MMCLLILLNDYRMNNKRNEIDEKLITCLYNTETTLHNNSKKVSA